MYLYQLAGVGCSALLAIASLLISPYFQRRRLLTLAAILIVLGTASLFLYTQAEEPAESQPKSQPKQVHIYPPLRKISKRRDYENRLKVKDLPPGFSGWTDSWTMYADTQGRLWLHSSHVLEAEAKPGRLLITKLGEEGYAVDLQKCPHDEWDREKNDGEFEKLPVAELSIPHETVMNHGFAQALLPESLELKHLSDLQEGESCWLRSPALYADKNGALWLAGSASYQEQSGGSMQVKKIQGRYELFIAEDKAPSCSFEHTDNTEGTSFLPVGELYIGNKPAQKKNGQAMLPVEFGAQD